MIVITGAAGFIGSNMAAELLENNYSDIVLVDDFSKKDKEQNWKNKK
jgi:ADP-L-glycero-D-manno-heptose 6-epimerase